MSMVDGVMVEGDRGGRWDLEKWRWDLRKKEEMWRRERKKKRNSGGEGVFILFPVAEGQESTGVGDEF
jgi:hypothetical protein